MGCRIRGRENIVSCQSDRSCLLTSGGFLGRNVFLEIDFFSTLFNSVFFFFRGCTEVVREDEEVGKEGRREGRRSRVIRLLAVGWGKEIIMEHRDDTSGTNVNRVRDCFRVRGARCTRENYGLSR